jgi:hypothetical protein
VPEQLILESGCEDHGKNAVKAHETLCLDAEVANRIRGDFQSSSGRSDSQTTGADRFAPDCLLYPEDHIDDLKRYCRMGQPFQRPAPPLIVSDPPVHPHSRLGIGIR